MATRKKKRPGRYCRVCGLTLPNEQFGSKGHAAHTCKACAELPPDERAEQLVLRRLNGMAFRHITDKERRWLETKCCDPNTTIQRAAQATMAEKFPRVVRNREKKGLVITALDLYIHGEAYDLSGEATDVHARVLADDTGRLRHVDYSKDGAEQEINIHRHEMQKFFKMLVHEWNAPFWGVDLGDNPIVFDPSIDILPEFREHDPGDVDTELETQDFPPPQNREPLWSLSLTLRGDKERSMSFYHQMHTKVIELYLEFTECFLMMNTETDDEIEDEPFD